MWKELFVILALLVAAFGDASPSVYCPEGSACQLSGNHLKTTSFEFLSKFTQKHYRSIVSLTITNASINKVDPKMKYLKNLQYLDLSQNNIQVSSIPSLNNLKTLKLNGNNLKYINLTALPQNIEILDISHNLLTRIPKDWRSLKSLKTLHLYKNPIDCDCSEVLNYDRLIKNGILVPESVTCHSPKKYAGKDIGAVNCSLDDIMLYDEPDEGSGTVDIFEDNLTEDKMNVPFVQDREDEVETALDDNTIIDDKEVVTTNNPFEDISDREEGSGDEGSGTEGLPDTGVFGCVENCSTPGPVGEGDEEYASPIPSAVDQFKMFWEDLNIFKESDPSTTSTISTTTTATTAAAPKTAAKEPKILKVSEVTLEAVPDKKHDAETISNNTNSGELERASVAPQNSTAIYAIVGVGVFLVVIFTVCFLKKRRSKRKHNNLEIPKCLEEEMKPLNQQQIKTVNEKPLRNIPESIPLINGQNGKPKSNTPKLTSFTSLTPPESLKEEEKDQLEPPQLNGQNNIPEDDVEVRLKLQPELLTPPRERVTIRESEIPDSIPKTPLLVHRQKNSDGEIVTTLIP